MNRESIIKEFEEKQKDDARVYFEHCEHYTDEFVEWLLSKVIAQGEEIERFKEQVKALNEEIIYDLKEACFERAEERDIIQSAHDKLKEENERLNSVMRVDKEIKRKSDKAGIELSSDFINSTSELKAIQSAYDKLKEENEEESKRAWDNFHRSEIDRKALMSLQEKYDKLKEENANLGATNETAALTGWICPSCDNSNHPFVTICSCGDAKK